MTQAVKSALEYQAINALFVLMLIYFNIKVVAIKIAQNTFLGSKEFAVVNANLITINRLS